MSSPGRVRVLFVCIGNACRSPMAEAIARREAADVIEASSAGLCRLGEIAPHTIDTLLANGYSTDGLTSKQITRETVRDADLVVNLTGKPIDYLFSEGPSSLGAAKRLEDWKITDPYGADAATYQTILEELKRRVRRLAHRLRASSRTAHA